ncbi:MAG TPA: GTP-binding protein [Acidobacteriota bacterium]|nr:GTP-binding protein [Acidobacteriota bacterium]
MPKFRQTAEILRLMRDKERIRNVGIVAHIDHGKTTMTDSLLAGAGLLSSQIAGRARALDYLEEEQKRGITIKTANISLLHETEGQSYVINLVDTPGHVDFTGKVTRALRAIDGAVVVVDAVEEIMVQTETVTRQALEERVRPVLFINKVDRLIKELKLSEAEIQNKFLHIIRDFNNLIEIYGEPKFRDEWRVSSEKETVAFGSALHKWGFTLKNAKEKGIKFTDIMDAYEKNEHHTLSKLLPLQDAILDMTVKNIPNPVEAQNYRLPKIWKGNMKSEVGKAMLNCDENGPTSMCITMAQMDPELGLIATGRLFSGSIREGDRVYLVGAKKEYSIQKVFVYMGAYREVVDQITSGNISALLGLDSARAGETLIDAAHEKVMVPFEPIIYASEPVMTIVVEPTSPKDLPRLIDDMNRLSIEDPNIVTSINKETGEYLLSGMGELHLEIALNFLKNYAGGIEIAASNPTVEYRESITRKGSVAMARSSNKQNTFWVQVEPIQEKALKHAKIGRGKNVWATDEHQNILLNLTNSFEYSEETKNMIISGFNWACQTGPLCEEPLRNVKVKLMDARIAEEAEFREETQISRAMSRAILGSFLTADPLLLEPAYRVIISVPTQWIGECSTILTRRHGKILTSEQKGALAIITGYIPVAETFGMAAEMRSKTSGSAFWQCTFDHWQRMPEKAMSEIIRQIRISKGLPPEIPSPDKFIDET